MNDHNNAAGHLVREAGYYRHKQIRQVSINEFKNKPYVKYIQPKGNCIWMK